MNSGDTDCEVINIHNLCDAKNAVFSLYRDKSCYNMMFVQHIVNNILGSSAFTFANKIDWIQDLHHNGVKIVSPRVMCPKCNRELEYNKNTGNYHCKHCIIIPKFPKVRFHD